MEKLKHDDAHVRARSVTVKMKFVEAECRMQGSLRKPFCFRITVAGEYADNAWP